MGLRAVELTLSRDQIEMFFEETEYIHDNSHISSWATGQMQMPNYQFGNKRRKTDFERNKII